MSQHNMNEDLNIVANSNLEITLLDGDLNIIQKLDDEPNDVGGLTSAELKAKFDEAGNTIKTYINGTLIPEILAEEATEAARAAAEETRVANENVRIAAEDSRSRAESGRFAAEEARAAAEQARVSAETARGTAEQAREAAEQARADENTGIVARATEQANIASSAASSASNSASEASLSKTAAQASKTAAAESASAAANSATSASAAASAASGSASAAKVSETAAAESASASQQSATSAAESAAVYDTVVADVNQLKQEFNNVRQEISGIATKTEIGCNIYPIISSEYEQIKDINTVSENLDMLKRYGITHILLPIIVQPTKAERDRILSSENINNAFAETELITLPSFEYVDEVFRLANEKGISIDGIKIHSFWIYDIYKDVDIQTFFDKYGAAVLPIAERYNDKIEFFNILNELYDVCSDENAVPYISNLVSQIKGVSSCKVGLCGVDIPTALIDIIDVYAPHSYPHISSKGNRTTYDDFITAWELSGLKERLNNTRYSEKRMLLTESGVLNYWEALDYPEKYISSGTKSNDNSVQYMFIKSLKEYLQNTSVEMVYLWYMDLSTYYPLIRKVVD